VKPGKLYIKIFLSFLVVLIVTEILIFGLFIFSARRIFFSRFERYTRAQVLLAKKIIEDKVRSQPETSPADNESLRNLILQLGKIHGSKIWLAAPDGRPLIKSFAGDIPDDVAKISKRRLRDLGDLKIYSDFKRGRFFYITIPAEVAHGEVGTLHILSEKMEKDHHEGVFALGLAGIGLVIALLIIPVSRLVTEPLKALRESALRIAEGNLSHRATVRSKDEIGELGRAFNSMADKLERMIRGGRELTANISHELRSPLARIRIAEELLGERLARGEYDGCRRQLDEIREDIGELDRLIDRILVLSKLDVHEKPLRRERLDPSDLINELLERFKPAVSQKRLRVTAHLSCDPPFFGDTDALRTAFSNILDNAVKFTGQNGDVIVKMHTEDEALKISVTNSFDPLSEEDLARIFEPFYRTERSHATGSGLGLAITKKIIERHGGNIKACNSAEGLTILVWLPRGPSAGDG